MRPNDRTPGADGRRAGLSLRTGAIHQPEPVGDKKRPGGMPAPFKSDIGAMTFGIGKKLMP